MIKTKYKITIERINEENKVYGTTIYQQTVETESDVCKDVIIAVNSLTKV